MKKIPTLFERKFENHRIIDILPNVTNGMEWVLNGEGDATIKLMALVVQLSTMSYTSGMMLKREKLYQKGR